MRRKIARRAIAIGLDGEEHDVLLDGDAGKQITWFSDLGGRHDGELSHLREDNGQWRPVYIERVDDEDERPRSRRGSN